jgi:hypothetical protein
MIQHLSDDELVFEASADDINEFISPATPEGYTEANCLSVALTTLLLHT